jgi:hypothetical protein
MAFRFRRSKKILPGVRLNVSKSGVSTSIGPRGASVTVGKRGVRATVGLPGTGLSYSTQLGPKPKRQRAAQPAAPAPAPAPVPHATQAVWPLVFLAFVLGFVVAMAIR